MEPCPFCGVASLAPHETQAQCIEALQAEIARVREVLSHVHSAAVPSPPADDDTPPED